MFKSLKRISEKFKLGKKEKKRIVNDRGAALISVLIAVTFIAIIATSLLYMVYMNYLAKVMRYGSTDNFYTAEFALDDLSSELQQIAVDKGKAGGDISAAIAEIRTQVGAGSTPGKSTYNPTMVQDFVRTARNDASIVVTTSYPTGAKNYEDTDTQVKLKGVVITATDEKGYVSTITSDIIIKFSPQGQGDLDICDFSIITDDPIYIGSGDFIMTGYAYTQKHRESGHDASCDIRGVTVPAGASVYINGGATVHILSERAIFNGDVIINGPGVVEVYGDVYIMGDLKIDSEATLIMAGGSIKLTGSIEGSGYNYIEKKADSLVDNWSYPGGSICPMYDSSAPDGLVSQLFCDNVMFYNSEQDKIDYFDFNRYFYSSQNGCIKDADIKYKGKDDKPKLTLWVNTKDDFNDSLVDSLALIVNQPVLIRGTCVNSTVVSKYGYGFNKFEQTNPVYMQKMDKEQYNWFINTCLSGIHNTGELYDSSGHNIGSSGMVGVTKGTEMPTTKPSGFEEESYVYGSETRTIYYDPSSDKCYLPIKYLLDDNTSGVITKLFSSVSSVSDPTTSTVIYENWSKE
ncbi:MAG: FapA family protein [Lachnospiraceae bacterium]|nr:FapA family protein [Lachnospiraceae bacterium]